MHASPSISGSDTPFGGFLGEKVSIFVGFSDGFALNRLENQTGVESAKFG